MDAKNVIKKIEIIGTSYFRHRSYMDIAEAHGYRDACNDIIALIEELDKKEITKQETHPDMLTYCPGCCLHNTIKPVTERVSINNSGNSYYNATYYRCLSCGFDFDTAETMDSNLALARAARTEKEETE